MKQKLLFFVLSLAAVAAFIGCHSGGHAPFANVGGGDNVQQSMTRKVIANGQLESAITFPSGATFNTSEDGTMQGNVEVTVTESKTSNLGANPIGNPHNIYIYTISAVLKTTDALGQTVSTPVYTLDKPLTVTLPTSHLGTNGIAYVGVRLSENEPWRYTRLNENGQITLARKALRASSEKLESQYSFGIFRTNLQIAIFVYNEESGHTESISADSFKATVTEKIAKKDGAYSEDIDVSFSLDGLNLDKINAADITAQVTYKTKSQSPATIKVNGTNCTYFEKGKSDAAVDGTSYYAHTFKVSSLEAGTVMSGQADYSFKLNLNSVKADDFPTEFLLEVSCNAKTEGLIPFSYAQYMTFTAEGSSEPEPEPQPEPQPDPEPVIETYTLTLNKGDGIESVTGADNYEAGVEVTASCTMLDGYEFANWSGDFDTESFTMPEKDVTMTANAKPIEYKINYITDGGVFADGVASPTLYTVEDAFSIPTPIKTYYNFKLWVDSDGAYAYTIVPGTTGDKTLTASYTPKYFAISYDLAGGSLAEGVTNPASYSIESQKITLNNPTRTGYTFTGWSGTGLTGEANMEVTIQTGSTGNKEYTAHWSINSYRLDMIAGTGIATVTGSGTYEYNSSVTASCTMQEGYEFVNWTGNITTDTFNMPAKNATMTANATPISYSITYDLASGTLEEGKTNPATYSIESSLITLNNPTRDGYVFIGWTGTDIEEGTATTTVKIAAGSTGDRSYVASYTLKYVNKLTKINDKKFDQIYILKGFGRGNQSYNSSLTAVEAWNLAKYQAEKDGVTVYVIMSSQDRGYDIHYAVSSDEIATENNIDLYGLCDGDPESNGKRMYYVAQ